MYCRNCGSQLEPGAAFCGICGTKVETKPESKPLPMPEPTHEPSKSLESNANFFKPASFESDAVPASPVPPASGAHLPPLPPTPAPGVGIPQGFGMPVTDWKNSYFEGGTAAHFGMKLVTGLLSVLSLGFAVPALRCWYLRWKYRNTVVGGYRLKFNGTGGQLFGKWILWCLLCIVTIGIFTIWLPVKLLKWETKHIEIDSVVLPPIAK